MSVKYLRLMPLSNSMKSLIKPRKLSPGDTVATITLSWGGAATFPERYKVIERSSVLLRAARRQ